jgi:hypothetical protein
MLDRIARRILPSLDRFANNAFYNDPLTAAPIGSKDEYLRLWSAARAKSHPAVEAYEQRTGAAIDREWLDRLALRTQIVVKKSELSYQHGRLVYSTVAALAKQHDSVNIVETGTARGFSALCMAKALSDAGKAGKIITFDVIPHDVPMYWNCIADHEDGRRQSRRELLDDYAPLLERYVVFHQGDTKLEMPKVSIPRVHLAFFDGVHTRDYVTFEFESIRERQQPGDVVFFDDYTVGQFSGVVEAVDEICAKYGYDKDVIRTDDKRAYVIATKR